MTLKEYLFDQIKDVVPDPQPPSEINNNPKIIFANGHWRKIFRGTIFGYEYYIGPDEGGINYWADNFAYAAKTYFGVPNADEKYVDGSSKIGFDQSGQDRVDKGEAWAESNYDYLTSNSSNVLDFYLVAHSEGGAFAVGIANYLNSRGHNIKEIVLLSCDEADEFSVNRAFPTYQIVLAYWGISGNHVQRWAIRVDWMVGNHRLRGATKYGVIIGGYSFTTVHGYSNGTGIFLKVSDLKDVNILAYLNPQGQTFFRQSIPPNNTRFYSVDDTIFAPNHPGWDPVTETVNPYLNL